LSEKTSLGIIEDEMDYREGLKGFFQQQSEFGEILSANSVETFLEAVQLESPPDLILLDIGLPGGMSGLEGIIKLREQFPEMDIVMLTSYDEPDRIFRAIQAGADAYLTKRARLQEIKETILMVRGGGSYMPPSIARKFFDYISGLPPKQKTAILTKKQEEIVQYLVKGLSYKMIADEMEISIETVRDHIKKIYRKLHINCKVEVIRLRLEGKI
jgi:DNA-binding NarL/FixJ family response regulator